VKIVELRIRRFRTRMRVNRDSRGCGYWTPGRGREGAGTLLAIVSDDGAEGYCFSGNAAVLEGLVKPLLVGEVPHFRERIWQRLAEKQRGNRGALTDGRVSVVDEALWDLAGRAAGVPVHKLLGGYRRADWTSSPATNGRRAGYPQGSHSVVPNRAPGGQPGAAPWVPT
jgi:L-alanine-DL-glutamate epimerase-like enolase superfamily enzyme